MLKLKRFDEGVWYDWPNDPQIRLKIRAITPKKLLDLREKSKKGKIAISLPNGETQIIDDNSESRVNWECFCWMLEDWQGIEFEGSPSMEEKKEIIFNHTQLRDFISDKSSEIFQTETAKIEAELKNLVRSQSGSQKSERQDSGAKNAGKSTKD
jgi:hypothetical protein